jgi:hypothetical protein
VLDRAFVRPAGGRAVTAQVAGHHVVALGEKVDLVAPVFVRAQEPVHEDQGRGAATCADEIQADEMPA